MINKSTMKKIAKLENLQQLELFSIEWMPELFPVADLSAFVKVS